jgi:hypothetical protein
LDVQLAASKRLLFLLVFIFFVFLEEEAAEDATAAGAQFLSFIDFVLALRPLLAPDGKDDGRVQRKHRRHVIGDATIGSRPSNKPPILISIVDAEANARRKVISFFSLSCLLCLFFFFPPTHSSQHRSTVLLFSFFTLVLPERERQKKRWMILHCFNWTKLDC